MPKPTAQFVPCLRCTRGRNGDKSCSSGGKVRTLEGGCFLGAWFPGKAPKKMDGVPVQAVEATSYTEARRKAEAAGYQQWIWVRDGIPCESSIGRYR